MRLHSLARLILSLSVLAGFGARGAAWPFDQRTILLARMEGREFPDDVTTAQVLDAFVKKGRVRWVMQKGGKGQILPVEVPADFQWQSAPTVKNLGLRYKADGIVLLQQKGVEVDLRWYSTLDGQPLFLEKASLPAAGPRPGEEEARRKRLSDWMDDIWARIPGKGYVVKRDLTTVSIEGAKQAGLKVGDVLELKRLEQSQRHPLLKTLLSIEATLSGTAVVTSLGDPLATAKIEYESPTDPIQEGDRYEIKPASATAASEKKPSPEAAVKTSDGRTYLPLTGDTQSAANVEAGVSSAVGVESPAAVPQARILDVAGRLGWGHLAHTDTVSGGTAYALKASGPSVDVVARGYLTREWIADLKFGFRHYFPAAVDALMAASKLGADVTALRLGAAYRWIFIDDPDSPGEFTIGFGYQRRAFSVTQGGAALSPVGKTYTGLDFALGLKVPVHSGLSVFAAGSRVMGAGLVENPLTTGDVSSGNALWNFEAGVAWKLSVPAQVSVGLDSASSSSNFTGNGTRSTSAISNVISSSAFFAGYAQRF